MAAVDEFRDDTSPTEEDGVLAELRRDGLIGPFVVADWAADSDIGIVRSVNEDRWGVVGDVLFVVADGMGGHDAGSLAAATAVAAVERFGRSITEVTANELCDVVNQDVIAVGERNATPSLGTTLVVLGAHKNYVVVLSVGDSRVYRFRGGELEQLTTDHTVKNELLASGVAVDVAERSNLRLDALTSHIGRRSAGGIGRYIASFSVMDADRFLLCTDGVHGQLLPDRMAAAMSEVDCRAAVEALLREARGRGGSDNATAVVAEFRSEDQS